MIFPSQKSKIISDLVFECFHDDLSWWWTPSLWSWKGITLILTFSKHLKNKNSMHKFEVMVDLPLVTPKITFIKQVSDIILAEIFTFLGRVCKACVIAGAIF